MDLIPVAFGLFFIATAAFELWVAISLPRLLPVLRARAEASRKGRPRSDGAGPNAFDLMAANPRALLVARLMIAALAIFTIVFGWGFVTAG